MIRYATSFDSCETCSSLAGTGTIGISETASSSFIVAGTLLSSGRLASSAANTQNSSPSFHKQDNYYYLVC